MIIHRIGSRPKVSALIPKKPNWTVRKIRRSPPTTRKIAIRMKT